MKEKLGLSYHNIQGLHQIVDSIPERAGKWKTSTLTFNDHPEENFVIHHRDVIEAVRSLFGDPSLSQHLVTAPQKVFSDQERENRIYSEMWTSQWWHVVQVS
jgi:Plavaka transposase